MTNIWDDDYEPAPWAQRDWRLSTRSEVLAELISALAVDPRTAGRLTEAHREPAFDQATSTLALLGFLLVSVHIRWLCQTGTVDRGNAGRPVEHWYLLAHR